MNKTRKIKLPSQAYFLIACAAVILLYLFKPKIPSFLPDRSPTGSMLSGSLDPAKQHSDEEWKKKLNPEQYHILREQGTELPFTGALLHNDRKGTYYSVGCDEPVFRSEDKYDSGTGWPSFTKPITGDALVLKKDYELGYERIEVLDKCGGHLGHVFDDGPAPTGKRWCMNSVALYFVPDK